MNQVLADPILTMLRERRAELRESMSALEKALAAPAVGRLDFWVERVSVALVELSGDFTTHIAITEGPDGLHPDIVRAAPRLAHAVEVLTAEHAVIANLIEETLALAGDASAQRDPDVLREPSNRLLGQLVRHRQRGADLVFEAYESDIGGET
jgi:hypothetical protein